MDGHDCTPFFIAGFERSGTSLLRAVLHQHPALAIPARGELQFFSRWMDRYGDLSDPARRATFTDAFFSESKFRYLDVPAENVIARFEERYPTYVAFFEAVMEAYAAAQGKPRWGEKSTTHIFHLDKIMAHFPGAPIIVIVRDPRDTFLSVVRAAWHRKDHIQPAAWARKWNDTYAKAAAFMEHEPPRFLLYRHEDFVAHPEKELKRVLDFLGEQDAAGILDLSSVDWEQNSSFGDRGRVISGSSVGRWHRLLDREQLREIEKHAAPMMARFGYAQATAAPSWWRRLLYGK